MEGVGSTRMGSRSSTRYGPAAVFSGPVRKWKKKWVHISPANPPPNSSSPSAHLLLYKWTSLSQSNNNNNNANKDDGSAPASTPAPEDRPPRKFRYVPVSVIEEQMKDAAAKVEEEAKPMDISRVEEKAVKGEGSDGAAEVTDVPMEETQVSEQKDVRSRQELNETNLDLSLGLKAHDGDHGSGASKMTDQSEGSGQLERASSGGDSETKSGTNSETENRSKRKSIAPDLEMRV